MALPQSKDPPEPEPIRSSEPLGNVRQVDSEVVRKADSEVAGRRLAWCWLCIWIAIAALVVIWIAWGFSSGGWGNRSHSAVTPVKNGQSPPALTSAQLGGPGVAAFKAADKKSFIRAHIQTTQAQSSEA